MSRLLRRLAIAALVGYVALLGVLMAGQGKLIHPGWDGPSDTALATLPELQDIEITSEGHTLRGWYIPAVKDQPTLVIFHGNGGYDIRRWRAFQARGWGSLMVAYRGYAGNTGSAGETANMADARNVLDYATGTLGLTRRDIVLYGYSLGTGIASRMAAETDGWQALVLIAPYASMVQRARERYPFVPVSLLLRHRYETDTILAEITAPIMIVHGTADTVVPVHHGQALAAARPDATAHWLDGVGHVVPAATIAAHLSDFLAR